MNIHEMTLSEYIAFMKGKKVEHSYYNRQGQLTTNHRDAVISALQGNKKVTERVIRSMPYPLPRELPQWARDNIIS